jgi:PPOX class probable F420-dependent enzyme
MSNSPSRLSDRIMLGMRHRDAWSSATAAPIPGERGFALLGGHKYCLLTTFRRTGEPVPTPVWFGLTDRGSVCFNSEATAGKVKRIRANPSVRLAPCTARGKPLGPPAEGRARVLSEEAEWAERAIAANYGAGRRMYEGAAQRMSVSTLYVEVVPSDS